MAAYFAGIRRNMNPMDELHIAVEMLEKLRPRV
jgi:hypothetical protein